MDCPRPIKSVLPRFYPTWSSRTRPSMRIQRSEGLGSRLGLDYHSFPVWMETLAAINGSHLTLVSVQQANVKQI